ncbi:hypothetical protein DSECCO2_435770 [anaerobic digester metagenome]
MDNNLNVKDLLNFDLEAFSPNEIIYYPFCRNDAKMIQRIRNHTVTSNFFIFCDSFKRPGKDEVNTERSMDNAINKCGYALVSADKYYLDDLLDLKSFESSLKKRYGSNYTLHLADRKYRTRPFLKRYVLHTPKQVCLYYIVYESLSIMELLGELKLKISNKLAFGMVIQDFDYWFGAANLIQPNRRLIKILDPSFIIGPKKYWYSGKQGASFFKNWKKGYANPVKLAKNLVISHKKEYYPQREKDFEDYRELRYVGVIDG